MIVLNLPIKHIVNLALVLRVLLAGAWASQPRGPLGRPSELPPAQTRRHTTHPFGGELHLSPVVITLALTTCTKIYPLFRPLIGGPDLPPSCSDGGCLQQPRDKGYVCYVRDVAADQHAGHAQHAGTGQKVRHTSTITLPLTLINSADSSPNAHLR